MKVIVKRKQGRRRSKTDIGRHMFYKQHFKTQLNPRNISKLLKTFAGRYFVIDTIIITCYIYQ